MAEAIRAAQESGELSHLHGRRIDLGEDDPDWLMHKILKQEGFAPPLIERGKDIDRAEDEAEAIVARIRRRRAWLTSPGARATPELAASFNHARADAIEQYRAALVALNRAILDYNLTAPGALHRRGRRVDHDIAAVEREIPPLDESAFAPAPSAGPSFWRRLRRRLGRH